MRKGGKNFSVLVESFSQGDRAIRKWSGVENLEVLHRILERRDAEEHVISLIAWRKEWSVHELNVNRQLSLCLS